MSLSQNGSHSPLNVINIDCYAKLTSLVQFYFEMPQLATWRNYFTTRVHLPNMRLTPYVASWTPLINMRLMGSHSRHYLVTKYFSITFPLLGNFSFSFLFYIWVVIMSSSNPRNIATSAMLAMCLLPCAIRIP